MPDRIEKLEMTLSGEKLQRARDKVESAINIVSDENLDAESGQEAAENIYEVKRLLYEVKKENIFTVRKSDLLRWKEIYEESV